MTTYDSIHKVKKVAVNDVLMNDYDYDKMQVQYDFWWFADQNNDHKDSSKWQEKKSELNDTVVYTNKWL